LEWNLLRQLAWFLYKDKINQLNQEIQKLQEEIDSLKRQLYPPPQKIPQAVYNITKSAKTLTSVEKAKLWLQIDRILTARFAITKIPTEVIERTSIDCLIQTKLPSAKVTPLDSKIRITNLRSLYKIITLDWSSLMTYFLDYWDCEDYAWIFKMHLAKHYFLNCIGVAFGYTPLGYHGFNLVFYKENEKIDLRFLEPQTDQVWTLEENEEKKYQVDFLFI